MRNCRVNLYIYDFYFIGLSLRAGLNEMAEKIFADYLEDIEKMRKNRKSVSKGEYGKFGQLMQKYLNSQSSLATLIGMDKHKFGRVLYADSEIIALDLYVICKVLELDFNTVISEICHHLRLNTEKEQQVLKEEHKAYLASLKEKRDKKTSDGN